MAAARMNSTFSGSLDKVGGLLSNLKRTDQDNLHEAVRSGDSKFLGKRLRRISSNAVIDTRDNDGRTPYVAECRIVSSKFKHVMERKRQKG